MNIREFLSSATFVREEVDEFLDPSAPTWAKFDAELGYRLSDILIRDGVDGCYTIGTYLPNGARRTIHYADRPCRINTYGDSFTQCHQVSDGETWQEVLAAHFGEPIRNFGVGGFGVYQAYRRIRRTEPTSDGAEYVILNIFDDDHYRNVDMARWMRTNWFNVEARRQGREGARRMFHATPWAHVRLDRATGKFVERENPFPTPQSLYKLCDAQFVFDTFSGDEVIQLELLQQGGEVDDLRNVESLAEALGVSCDFRSSPEARKQSARKLLLNYSLRSTIFAVDLAADFVARQGKELLILLSYGHANVIRAIRGEAPFDQLLLDHLNAKKLRYVDSRVAHTKDASDFRIDPQAYINRYYIGHYNPLGNHFFAFAVKNAMLEWLDPKPITYQERSEKSLALLAAKLA